MRQIQNTRARLDLMDAIADMMHVVRAECDSEDPLEREAVAFSALWDEIEAAVPKSLAHFDAEAIPKTRNDAVEVVLINNRKAGDDA